MRRHGNRPPEAGEKLPKPLVDIGGKPVLWHVMKTNGHYGFGRFVPCLGYRGDLIRRYFLDYREWTGPGSVGSPAISTASCSC